MTHYITDIMTCNKQIRVRRHICGQMLHKLIIIALMMVVGGVDVWGQTDYSGTYYIASGGKGEKNGGTGGTTYNYNASTPTNNFYLCPTEGWCYYKPDNDFSNDGTTYPNPFLTTYKCRDGAYDFTKAVWIIRKHSSENYYYIIQAKTGKYLLSNGQIRTTDNPDRIRVHLEAVAISNLDDKALFSIVPVNGYYRISPKDLTDGQYLTTLPSNHGDHSTHAWLTVNYGNYNYLVGRSGKTGGPNENGIGDYRNTSGTVGIYTESDTNTPFYFEEVVQQPVISQAANGDITLTCATSNTTIYYTLDGSDPVVPADGAADPTGPTYKYNGTFSPAQGSTGVKAVAVLSNLHAAVSKMAELSLICSTPTISFNGVNQTVTISATPADATIYYTTDGSDPIEGTSSVYSTPFTLTTTIVKAIATHAGFMTSDIATLTITQVATPTIQDNGSNAISITTETEGATIYYTTDGSTPTTSSTEYTGPLTENVSGVTIKAIAVKENMIPSEVGSGAVTLQCSRPSISKVGDYATISCSFPSSGVSIYYTKNGGTPSSSSTLYSGSIPVTIGDVIKAIAIATGYNDSEVAEKTIHEELTPTGGIYYITNDYDFETFVDMANTADGAGYHYVLQTNVNASTAIIQPFTGTFDGGLYTISGLDHALFNTIDGGIVRNVMLEDVSISSGNNDGNAGAICNEATGAARIYNCGVLGGSVSGSNYVGGLVGLLDGRLLNGNILDGARVINCFSYANITGGSYVGGIVGYNNFATTSTNLKTMVMNCMFYGDITGGTNKAPIYNGEIISNTSGNLGVGSGVGNYNYFRAEATFTGGIDTYNCALMAETRFLQRFEFFRHLMNSHLELAGWWATGTFSKEGMAKWVLEPSQIGSEHPYPILKPAGKYPSVINIDAENAPHTSERNKGAVLGTLTVNIQMGNGAQYEHPTGAEITTSQLTLNITDKDPEHFNFNYYKVQLPYYNDVGTKNYNGNRVVTGWKIVSIAGGTAGTYSTGADAVANAAGEITSAPYNFADRNCTKKDLYSESGRVFNQGAYWDVPEGVTAITIEPYWAKCVYLADASADVVYNENMTTADVITTVGGGTIFTNGSSKTIAGDSQRVYTSMSNAIASSTLTGGLFAGVTATDHTVYDYAVVLVGNYHYYGSLDANTSKPYTVTSIDLDHDNEPDYSYILRFDSRVGVHPVRVDFINIPGLGMAQKSTGSSGSYNFGIMNPKGWFEATNTALFRVTQFEYETSERVAAPYILQGGVIDQWVSSQTSKGYNTSYIHVGGNVWFKEFHLGCHQDKTNETKHPPVSVTGGDYNEFYLTGLYSAAGNYEDNAECYINGGRFGTVAGAGIEGIGKDDGADNTGNIVWQIQNADIEEFYGGGINAAKPIEGSITTVITGSHVNLFCGGPKFGDMNTGKTVITTATNCTFGTFFGAGYGGNSYYRAAPRNFTGADASWDQYNVEWNRWIKGEIKPSSNSGNYANGNKYSGYKQDYNSAFGGVSVSFDYQFLPVSSNDYNVARLFIDFVKFSLATTQDVTSKLTGCTVTGNFYGGGSLGKVDGDVNSTLTNCTVHGNVFGGGYDVTLPTVSVMNTSGFVVEPKYDTNTGTFIDGVLPSDNIPNTTTTYTWEYRATVNSTATAIDKENHILYTSEDLTTLGQVTGDVTLNINGTTTVGESVYGGGEESGVVGNTYVTVNGGRVGVGNNGKFGYRWGNVYGGGKGMITVLGDGSSELTVSSIDDLDAGYVMGNTNVTINGGTILHNIYGGGAVGSVGTFTRNTTTGMPTACAANTGLATVTINGGIIGHNHEDTGMVNGSSRGWEGNPNGTGAFAFLNQLAWVNNTNVIIGDPNSDEEDVGPTIFGSVYGGGENGHNFGNGVVTVNKGTIGYDQGTWDCGNIYGAGCGTDPFERDDNGNGEIDEGEDNHHNPMSGIVLGTTTVTINGGHVLRNVYGGGAMGSVGTYTYVDGLPTTCAAGTGNTTININGGIVGVVGSDYGHVFGGPKGNLSETEYSASVRATLVNINAGADIKGSVFGGGEAGIVREGVTVNMTGGHVLKDVYGGGALADTQTDNWDATANSGAGGWAAGKTSASATTTVSLTGGIIGEEVFGGGLGQNADSEQGLADIEARVYGNVLVELNKNVADDAKGCVVLSSIFGCNNLNGTPMGDVMVHIYKTQNNAATCIANAPASGGTPAVEDAKVAGRYDVLAVYGGGNMAAYVPANPNTNKTEVVIDGCDLTSIRQVYGGGNAACTPSTNVTVNGTFEILELFGGGNGLDDIHINGVTMPNPGANVGYMNYSEYYQENGVWKVRDMAAYDTKEERTAPTSGIVYGTGKAAVTVYGGTVHRVFGGSNTKGNVRQTAVTMLDEAGGCDFCVDEAYGGGKSAEMDAEAQLLMACIPGLQAVYGGAEAADVRGNVTLNITNGTFDRVFGGNNLSGTIGGAITINVEEIGCRPVKIGELYGGGNQAAYSVYGYDSNGQAIESGTTPLYDDPQINVMSFTSIGQIFGGGYGSRATMVGNPTVNVNVAYGRYYNQDASIVGENAETPNHYPIPSHVKGKMGAINSVFGGGNAARVIGDTHVNIGTLKEVYVVKQVTADTALPAGCYTRNNDGSYTAATGTAVDGITYYEKQTVIGADIRGNVYGGGNNAEVTGDTHVVIGKPENTTPDPSPDPSPEP